MALDADPPRWLSWSSGLYTDEGFYTLDARHEALFGTWAPGNFHDRLLSPLLSGLQQAVFAVSGAGIVPARLISVAFGLLTLAVFWIGLRRIWGERAALWGVLLLGLAPPFAFYNRLALQETPTVFWLVLAWALWGAGREAGGGRRRSVSCALAGAAAGIALVFKPLAVVALPGLVGVTSPPAPETSPPGPRREETSPPNPLSSREGERKEYEGHRLLSAPLSGGEGLGVRSFLALAAVLALYGALWYGPHQAELARMGHYYRTHQFQPHSLGSLWLNVRRGLIDGERGVAPYLMRLMPIPCALALLVAWRRWWGEAAARVLMLWLLGGLAFCLLSSYAPDRYYVLFLPALCGLAARGAAGLGRRGQALALGLFLATSGFRYAQAWAERDWARRDAAWTLAQTLPSGSVVVGDIAPELCLGTPFAAAPLQPGLSNDDRPVERLGATHIAVIRAPVWQAWWRSHYPDLVQPSHRVAALRLGGRWYLTADVYQVSTRGR